MIQDHFNILKHISVDQYTQWVPLTPDMNAVCSLVAEDLSRIIKGIESDEDLFDFCQLSDNYSCFVLTECKTAIPMCFCILEFGIGENQMIFHGGRLPNYNNIMLVYRGTAKLLKALLDLQFDVLTTTNYDRAIRFDNALGFYGYKTDGRRIWMRLTPESLKNSLIGRRLLFD